jgi:crotonobetaine/carnitine-CoA ligase
MISNNYICNMGWQSGRFIGVRHEDVYWTPCPLFHLGAAGGTIGTAQVGATMSIYPRFSLSRFWPEIERSRATVVMLLSSMLNFVADAPDTDESKRCFGQIRTIHGVPFGASLRSRWKERFGVRFAGAVGYGMTEACSITLTDLEQPNPADASGRRFEDFDVQIVDEKDRLLGPGQAGEVVVRPLSPNIMFDGYWRRPESTLEANRNLWFHTGDIGRIDANGFFYFVDRKKDYLRRGGENISSYEMEVAFRTHPDIQDVAVHAVSSSAAEDEIKVTAILCAGASVSPEALCRWSMEHLPIFAVPRYVEFRTDFPRNGVGRILKYELRNEGVTSATWDRDKSRLALRKR